MDNGELKITGESKIEIDLNHKPSKVKVKFEDNVLIETSINKSDEDKLGWAIHQKPPKYKHHKNYSSYILTIYWKIIDTRTISWHVYY